MDLQDQPLDLSRSSEPKRQPGTFFTYGIHLNPMDLPVNLTTAPIPRRNSLTDHSDRSNTGSPESDCSAYYPSYHLALSSDSESELKPSPSSHPYRHTKPSTSPHYPEAPSTAPPPSSVLRSNCRTPRRPMIRIYSRYGNERTLRSIDRSNCYAHIGWNNLLFCVKYERGIRTWRV